MSVAPMCSVNGLRTFRAVGFRLDGLLFLRPENEKRDQPKDGKRACNGQNYGQNIHTLDLGVWSKEFKQGVATC